MVTVSRTVRRRGFFGHLFKWSFVLFNIAMLVWLLRFWTMAVEPIDGTSTDAEIVATGAGIFGATFGVAIIWIIGGIVLGVLALATRGRVETITEER